jgi:two-component system cell cycle sensor histidine kinase/response regulator CckA
MSQRHAIELPVSPLEAIQAGSGVAGGLLPALAAVGAGAAVLIAMIASGVGQPLLLVTVAILATIGLFFTLAYASGYVRIGLRMPLSDLVKSAADSLDQGLMISSRDGEALYANSQFESLVGRTDGDRMGALQELFTGEPQASAALFRLTRAGERGEYLTEEFSLKDGTLPKSGMRTIRASVSPFLVSDGRRRSPNGKMVLWRIADVTVERQREAARLASVEVQLAQFDSAPVGLASIGADGAVLHANATLARWIGRTPKSVLDDRLTLADITSGDGAGLITNLFGRAGGEGASLDAELLREDGRIVPVRLLARTAPNGRGLTVAVLNLATDAASEFEGDATGIRFARFFQSAPFGIAIVGPDGVISNANIAFGNMLLEGASGIGSTASDLLCRAGNTETRLSVEAGLKRVLSGRAVQAPIEITVGSQRDRFARVFMAPFAPAGGKEAAILYVVDATEQKALEAKFAQSQKMEVVGKLAGGIAHDFNNMLTAILGFSDMLLSMHRPKDVAYKDIKNIQQSANRAAELVRKLLTLARQQTLQNEVVNLGELLTDEFTMFKRYLGEKCELRISSTPDLWYVMVDKGELIQALFNLITNAKDAMNEGGTLSISARNVSERESQKLAHREFVPGEYVMVEVGDTGHGMSPEVMNKIFEPFFTTKAVGKGTGLGLASVYGMVKQSGGYIYPESEVGKGTTFRIYLPRRYVEKDDEVAAPKEKKKEPRAAADLTGTGRVLLVEDEEVVRNFAARALKRQGYKVLEASSGVEALEVMEKNKGKIDIVVSDVVMPEMDGPTLLKELRKKNPELKIIFVSGYPNDAFKSSIGDEEFAFLPKPFSLPQLAAKVKEELAR